MATFLSQLTIAAVAVFVMAMSASAQTTGGWMANVSTPQTSFGFTAVAGWAGTNNLRSPEETLDLAFRVDHPVARLLVRAEAGRASWHFDGAEKAGPPPPASVMMMNSSWRPPADHVTIRRGVVSVLRTDLAPFYWGAGIGAYHYRHRSTDAYCGRPWRFGLHGVAGLDLPLTSSRLRLTGELQLHMPGVPPSYSPVNADWFTILNGAVGLKIRM